MNEKNIQWLTCCYVCKEKPTKWRFCFLQPKPLNGHHVGFFSCNQNQQVKVLLAVAMFVFNIWFQGKIEKINIHKLFKKWALGCGFFLGDRKHMMASKWFWTLLKSQRRKLLGGHQVIFSHHFKINSKFKIEKNCFKKFF